MFDKPMNPVLKSVAEFLKSKEFRFSVGEADDVMFLGCSGERLCWTTLATTDEAGGVLSLLSRFPVLVPAAKRAACAQLLARLNHGQQMGSFQLDMSDGEVMYCVSHVAGGQGVEEAVMDLMMALSFRAMDGRAPEILKLVYGMEPDAGGAKASGQKRDDRRVNLN